MINRRGHSGRWRLFSGRKESKDPKRIADIQRGRGSYDGTVVHRARTMRARRFLVMRIRL